MIVTETYKEETTMDAFENSEYELKKVLRIFHIISRLPFLMVQQDGIKRMRIIGHMIWNAK